MTERPTRLVRNNELRCNMRLEATYTVSGRIRGVYADMMEKFAHAIIKRQEKQYQTVVVVTGRTGSGKSTFAVTLATEIARQLGETWDVRANYIYSIDDLKTKLKRYQDDPSSVSRINLLDEGTVILSNRNVMSKEDKNIITLFETLRSYGFITLLCAPSYARLNMTIRENLTDFLVVCPDKPFHPAYRCRGSFEAFQPAYARWEQGMYWAHIGSGTFPPLEGALKREYEAVKLEHQIKITNKMLGLNKPVKKADPDTACMRGRPRLPDDQLKAPRSKKAQARIKDVDRRRAAYKKKKEQEEQE